VAGAVDGDLRAAGLDGWGWVSCFLAGIEEVWRGGDEVWKMRGSESSWGDERRIITGNASKNFMLAAWLFIIEARLESPGT